MIYTNKAHKNKESTKLSKKKLTARARTSEGEATAARATMNSQRRHTQEHIVEDENQEKLEIPFVPEKKRGSTGVLWIAVFR